MRDVVTKVLVRLMISLALLGGVAQAAEDFSLPGMDDKTHKLSDYRGKWVVVNYWATWCPPCLAEIPELVSFHEDHEKKDAVVLGINFEDVDKPTLVQFIDDYFINYPILLSKPGPNGQLGRITGLPTTYLIDPKGDVVAKQIGGVTAKGIEEFMRATTVK